MEKIKLAYLMLKEKFNLNFLKKIGCEVVALGSEFEKWGGGEKGKQGDKMV